MENGGGTATVCVSRVECRTVISEQGESSADSIKGRVHDGVERHCRDGGVPICPVALAYL
jgi:hypothetical protein